MVYVISKDGRPLMPTENHAKVRVLLKEGRAVVVRRTPFTIRLTYDTTAYIQDVSLGIDAGSKIVGISATTKKKVLYEAEVELRNDIVKLLSSRRELRRARRNRKTRYRKARFDNRKRPEGWLAPSVQQKIQTHLRVIGDMHKILPVSRIIVETAQFDIQKIKNPDIAGEDYQQGEQNGFWNVREYVLFRDNHTCQCCKGKSKDPVLNVHHIESRRIGGNAPNNLVTLCETCHTSYHKGVIDLPKCIKRGKQFRDATFMGIMRWSFYNKLKEIYPNVQMTYGYITKNTRIKYGLGKSHRIDARCISGNPQATLPNEYYYQKKVRCHNRQIHKLTIVKNGYRKRNQLPYIICGFRLFDNVKLKGVECFIFGRRHNGYFDLRTLDGIKISGGVSYRKLKLLNKRRSMLIERRSNANIIN